jgi:hypothetical protein
VAKGAPRSSSHGSGPARHPKFGLGWTETAVRCAKTVSQSCPEMSLAPKIERVEGPLHVSLLPLDIKAWCVFLYGPLEELWIKGHFVNLLRVGFSLS